VLALRALPHIVGRQPRIEPREGREAMFFVFIADFDGAVIVGREIVEHVEHLRVGDQE
jgi:hypothetical protein